MAYTLGFIPFSAVTKLNGRGDLFENDQTIKIDFTKVSSLEIDDNDPVFQTHDTGSTRFNYQTNADAFMGNPANTLGFAPYYSHTISVGGRDYNLISIAMTRPNGQMEIIGYTFEGNWPPQDTRGVFSFDDDKRHMHGNHEPDDKDHGKDGHDHLAFKPRQPPKYPCFLPGSMVATASGERPVEELAEGDLILTMHGDLVRVKWIGHKTPNAALLRETDRPVLVKAHAFTENIPSQDLYLSADHAFLLEGYLVNAGALVNGDSICFVDPLSLSVPFIYYHIETASHDVIIVNGAPAETFVDYLARTAFDNYDAYLERFGIEVTIPELPYMRISSARSLPPVLRARFGVVANDMAQLSAELDALHAS